MRAKEFIPASKPRNFVAKNQKTAGAGQHKDKKRAEKQGDVKHKSKMYDEGVEEGWKDEGDDFDEWSKYVKEKLTKAEPDQRLGIAKKLSQIEIKNFGSSAAGGFDKKTGKPTAGLGLTDTVRSALRYFNSEQDSIRRQSDQDGAPGNFSTKFGSVDIAGMENATPEELSVVKKAVGMSPIHASKAGAFYRKNGTITFKDLADIDKQIEKDSGVEFGKPMYSSPGAKASREKMKIGERIRDPEDWDEGNTEPGNNFAIYINGKKWKVFPGPYGAYADSPEEEREFYRLKAMAQRKSEQTGKKWEVYKTGEPATK
jgi:hypothetical protein